MKTLFQSLLRLAAISLPLILCTAIAANGQSARLRTDSLDYLAGKASETVDVNIDERVMHLTAQLFSSTDPDEKEIKALIGGLKGIYVKVFDFDHEGVYTSADVESIRVQLQGPGWSKIINYSSKKEGSVEVYLMTLGDQINGIAVLAADPKELTIVNIIGPVDLNKLTKLEGRFGVPDLDIEPPAKPKTKN
jgi:hypothetical protein